MSGNIVKYTLDDPIVLNSQKLWIVVPTKKHEFENIEIRQKKIKKINIKKKKKSVYPFEFRKKQKKMKQENRKCNKCLNDKYLQVHHKDRNKFNNEDSNLILLCFDCHKAEHKHLKLPSFIAKYG